MTRVIMDKERIKTLFKQALVEVLHEQRDVLYDVVVEAIEDLALIQAIKEGEGTDTVTEQDVLQALEDTL